MNESICDEVFGSDCEDLMTPVMIKMMTVTVVVIVAVEVMVAAAV